MTSSEEEVEPQSNISELNFIAKEIPSYPEILMKSQIPRAKKKKDLAVERNTAKYEAFFGKKIEITKLMKKVNNMKTRLKKKTDINKTGNRKIKLLDWEKLLFKAMEGDTNPTVSRIAGAKSCGVLQEKSKTAENESSSSSVTESNNPGKQNYAYSSVSATQSSKRNALAIYEIDETRSLTTSELQRLVLLEQLKTTRVQREYYNVKLQEIMEKSGNTEKITAVGSLTYLDL